MKARSGKVTREKKPAAQSAARRAASLLTGALIAVGLTGCGGGLFQIGDTADSSLTQKAKPSVALSPVQGVPQKYAGKVNEQLVASIKAKGVQIVEAKDAQYIVKATYVAVPEPKHGTKVTYTIDVTDKAGNKVRTIAGEELVSPKRGGDSWMHVTDEGVQKVALKSGTDLNAWIENPNAPPPAAVANAAPPAAPVKTAARTPAKPPAEKSAAQTPSIASAVDSQAAVPALPAASAPREVVAIVTPVAGAPGDGKTSLADAMKRALGRQGVKLAASAAPGHYKVQGQVELSAVVNGEQSITIRWVVVDPAGKQIDKTVVQSNKISAGSLDKAWGDIADLVAGPAAAEVTKLLNKPTPGQAQRQSTGSAG
jgi:hypothetical protein